MDIQRYPIIERVNVIVLKGIEKSGYNNLSNIFLNELLITKIVNLLDICIVKGKLMNYYPPPAMF